MLPFGITDSIQSALVNCQLTSYMSMTYLHIYSYYKSKTACLANVYVFEWISTFIQIPSYACLSWPRAGNSVDCSWGRSWSPEHRRPWACHEGLFLRHSPAARSTCHLSHWAAALGGCDGGEELVRACENCCRWCNSASRPHLRLWPAERDEASVVVASCYRGEWDARGATGHSRSCPLLARATDEAIVGARAGEDV